MHNKKAELYKFLLKLSKNLEYLSYMCYNLVTYRYRHDGIKDDMDMRRKLYGSKRKSDYRKESYPV